MLDCVGVEMDVGEHTCPSVVRAGLFMAVSRVTVDSLTAPDMPLDAVLCAMEPGVRAVTWDRVQRVAEQDPSSQTLRRWVLGGCNGQLSDLSGELRPHWRVGHHLQVQDGVVMFQDMVVVPALLCPDVLSALHCAMA